MTIQYTPGRIDADCRDSRRCNVTKVYGRDPLVTASSSSSLRSYLTEEELMQTRVPEKYLGSNEDATGHGPRLEHAPSTVRQRPRCSHQGIPRPDIYPPPRTSASLVRVGSWG